MTRVKVVFEGNVPFMTRARDRIAVRLAFSGHKDAARWLLRITGIKGA